VIKCAFAAEMATGATLKYTVVPGYAAMVPNRAMGRVFADNWRQIGVEVLEPRPDEQMGSTDMGNISQSLPALHPYIQIAPDGTAGHTTEFCAASISPEGHEGMLNAAKGMAMTAIDLLGNSELMLEVKREFAEWEKKTD
jgi:metal-dependent amidase/aminoacylase/carboxypeptidase family protein